MKAETRATVVMILKSDDTITQRAMDAILLAMDGNVLEEIVTREEARRIFHVGNRALQKMVKRGILDPVLGSGSRSIGYSRASVTALAVSFSTRKGRRKC